MTRKLEINGTSYDVDVDDETPLLWVLRDHLQLTGTKYGCGVAQCGACTVHIDGKPRRSCVTPVGSIGERSVTTIEGLKGKEADAVRKAWVGLEVPQCGYCQGGQIMSAVSLIRSVAKPSDEQIDQGMSGNVCRCATYVRIRKAIKEAAADVSGEENP